MNTGMIPPHPPNGADGNDPIHPDDYGPPPEDDANMPPNGANDSGEQDDDSGFDMDDPNLDPPQGGQPPFPRRRRRQLFSFRQHNQHRSQILMRP